MKLPQAKLENIVVQNLNDETLIYNLITNRALCLNDTSAKVFNACDGKTTFAELKSKHKYSDELIYLTLDLLKEKDLIESHYISPLAGLSRRETIRKVGLASMIALPLVSSLISPTAASAASGTRLAGQSCAPANNTQANCAAGLICNTSTGTCTPQGVACACVAPGDCVTQTLCASTVNCNSSRVCAP